MGDSRDNARRDDSALLTPTLPIRSGHESPPMERPSERKTPLLNHSASARRTPPLRSSEEPGASSGGSPLRGQFRGQRIGDYEIIEELARGGMGVVYKARQISLQRTVAIKMVLRGDFARADDLVRFQSEALAIAQLHHPNLVSIYEIGDHDGLPFFAMEYLAGGTLARRIDRQALDPRAATRFLLPLVEAIDYAHGRGLVHRDLKPANILLSDASGPIETAVAKITDFGVAKHLGGDFHLTRTGDILGTPTYMAPEQAGGSTNVGQAADVYSLGAILFEMLVGRPPFLGADPADTLLRVLHEEPTSPRHLVPRIPADLATICMKCLEKAPEKRYASARALADDLRRFLTDEPIQARPPSPLERVRKWIRRSPVKATVAAAAAVLLAIAGASMVTLWRQAVGRAEVEGEMVKERDRNLVAVNRLLAEAYLDRAIALAEKDDIARGLHWMVRSLEIVDSLQDRSPRAAILDEVIRYNLAHWSQEVARAEVALPHADWAWAVALSPDGNLAATGCKDGHVRLWKAETGQRLGDSLATEGPVWAVRFHPSGNTVFASGGVGQGFLRAFQRDPKRPDVFIPHGDTVHLPDSVKQLEVARNGAYVFVRLMHGSLLLFSYDERGEAFSQAIPIARNAAVAEFTPDSRSIAVGTHAGEVLIYDIGSGKFVGSPRVFSGPVLSLAVAPEGNWIAVGQYHRDVDETTVYFQSLPTARPTDRSFRYPGKPRSAVFSPDGKWLAVSLMLRKGDEYAGQVRRIRIDESPWEYGAPLAFARPVWALAFHPAGRHLVTGCEDFMSRIFEVATGQLAAPPVGHEGNVTNIDISRDGRRVITASSGGNTAMARVSEVPLFGLAPRPFGPEKVLRQLSWPTDGDPFAMDGDLKVLQIRSSDGKEKRILRVPNDGMNLWFAPPHHLVRYRRDDGRMILTDLHDGRLVSETSGIAMHWHDAHGAQVAGLLPIYNRELKLLRLVRGSDGVDHRPGLSWSHPPGSIFTHEAADVLGKPFFGANLPISAERNSKHEHFLGAELRIWDTDFNLLRRWSFRDNLRGALLSRSGKTLAVRDDHQIRFLDIAGGEPSAARINHARKFACWAFHPSEKVLAMGNRDRQITLWHVATGKPIGPSMFLDGSPEFVTARADGRGFVAGGESTRTVTWSYIPPVAGSTQDVRRWIEALTGTTLDDFDDLIPTETVSRPAS